MRHRHTHEQGSVHKIEWSPFALHLLFFLMSSKAHEPQPGIQEFVDDHDKVVTKNCTGNGNRTLSVEYCMILLILVCRHIETISFRLHSCYVWACGRNEFVFMIVACIKLNDARHVIRLKYSRQCSLPFILRLLLLLLLRLGQRMNGCLRLRINSKQSMLFDPFDGNAITAKSHISV